jgi:hypothetical protein
MRKVLATLIGFGLCAYAADFWQKPASEWTDKEVQKMMTNSPWAKPFGVNMVGPSTGFGTAQGNTGADPGGGAPISEGGGGGRGGRGGGGGGGAPGGGGGFGGGSVDIVARWQSAMPEKLAFVRMRFGAEGATSDQSKQILEHQDDGYVIILSGNLRPFLRVNPEGAKKIIQDNTVLGVHGKEAIRLQSVDVTPMQVVYTFSRATPLTVEDKEVEFTTKLADVVLKYKFRLKDMVYNGKLEL